MAGGWPGKTREGKKKKEKVIMLENDLEHIIGELIKSPEIRKLYDDNVMKDKITFEDWVRQTVTFLIEGPKPINFDEILKTV
jgi:hypothetical protein